MEIILGRAAGAARAVGAGLLGAATGDTSQSGGTDQAVQNALDLMQLLLFAIIGVAIGLVVSFVVSIALRAVFQRSRLITAMLGRTRGPAYWAFMAWGAYVGVTVKLQGSPDLSTVANGGMVRAAVHLLLILAIAAITWVLFSAMWVVEDAARLRHQADQGRSRRFETQAQVLRRLLQVLAVILGIAWILFTFPAAQKMMTTVLASAGVISVIAGLAAQSTLGNVFAGIQLAFTDAIRVGDVVVAGPNGDQGAIEEITLTYVVVRVWDERRLIMPSTQFASEPFENWTRRAARQLGTIELQLDWAAPMAQIRERVEHLLMATDLWDGRTWNVQMTDSDKDSVTVRVLVSAKDSGTLWDLRCYLRENLVAWLAGEEAWTRPVTRIQPQATVTVEHDASRERVARLAEELADIAGPVTAGNLAPTGRPSGTGTGDEGGAGVPAGSAGDQQGGAPVDAVHAARMHAARRKAKRARRRAMAERQRELAEGHQGAARASAPADRGSAPGAGGGAGGAGVGVDVAAGAGGVGGAGAGVAAGAGAGGAGGASTGVAAPTGRPDASTVVFGADGGAAAPTAGGNQSTRVFTVEELRDIARHYGDSVPDASSGGGSGHSGGRPVADTTSTALTPAVPAAPAAPGTARVLPAAVPAGPGPSVPVPVAPPAAPAGPGPSVPVPVVPPVVVPPAADAGSPAPATPTGPAAAVPPPVVPPAAGTMPSGTAAGPGPAAPAPVGPAVPATQPAPATGTSAPASPSSTGGVTTTSGGRGERLYSGSPEAEERRQIFAGPGEDALAEREEAARKRAEQAASALTGTAAPRGGDMDATSEAVDAGGTAPGATAPDAGAPTLSSAGLGTPPIPASAGVGAPPVSPGTPPVPEPQAGAAPDASSHADPGLDETRVMPAIRPRGQGKRPS